MTLRLAAALSLIALLVPGCKTAADAPPRPVGRVLACTMKVDGEWGLWLIYLDSGEQKRIGTMDNAGADWSPDGYRVVYSDGKGLRLIRSDGFDSKPLPGGLAWAPAWSPDGNAIAYGTLNSVMSRPLEGDEVRIWSEPDLNYSQPTWAPDGRRLAMMDSEGKLVITDGSAARAFPAAGCGNPDWSPDGKRILLEHEDGKVRVCDPATGALATLGSMQGRSPKWLKGGTVLTCWQAPGDSVASVYEWDSEGTLGKKLTDRDEVREADGNW